MTVDHDIGTGGMQRSREMGADAPRATGDQDGPAAQPIRWRSFLAHGRSL
jgi:hypothetical protein